MRVSREDGHITRWRKSSLLPAGGRSTNDYPGVGTDRLRRPDVVVQDPGCFSRIVGGPNGTSRSSLSLPSRLRKLVIAPSGSPSSL
jgi:hypothetical protein